MFTIYFMYIISCCTGHHVKKGKHQSNNQNIFPEKMMKIPLQLKMEQACTVFFFWLYLHYRWIAQRYCIFLLHKQLEMLLGPDMNSLHHKLCR